MHSAATQAISCDGRTIPAMVVGPLTEERQAVLLWVHTGAATVRAEGAIHSLAAGQAIWVPPGIEHSTHTTPGTVVIPLFLQQRGGPGALSELRIVEIPTDWQDWLIHQWDDNSHTSDVIPGANALRALVAAPPTPTRRSQTGLRAVRLPRSREALDVARTLLRDPASPRSLESFVTLVNISTKTLRRQFLHETGMTFSTWRTRARVATAADLLAAGGSIGETRRRVGFTTAAGFTKAFKHHTGCSPRDYTRLPAEQAPWTPRGSTLADQAAALARDHRPTPPPIPRRAFWTMINDFHVLMWVYRGEGMLRAGTRAWRLIQGQAMWVPAGLSHTIEFAEGSLMLSLARCYRRAPLRLDDLIVFSFSPEADPFLLHTLVADYTLFHHPGRQGAFAEELFRMQLAASHRDSSPTTGALADITHTLRRSPADPRSLADWAAHFDMTPRQLGAEFLSQTSDTFPRWRARLRMDVARTLLRLGHHPGDIARHLGYASPATFTKAFTSAHGIPPRDYRAREQRR